MLDGGLRVNGNLTGMTVDIGSSASLSGIGTVGQLLSNGRVNPGNSVGTLRADSFDGSRGTLVVEFDAAGTNKLIVDGTATLSKEETFFWDPEPVFYGGRLELVEIGTGIALNTAYTFLEAANIDGEFDEVTTVFLSGSELKSASVSYTATTAEVTFSDVSTNFGGGPGGPGGPPPGFGPGGPGGPGGFAPGVPPLTAPGTLKSGRAAGGVIDALVRDNDAAAVGILNGLLRSDDMSKALESQGNTVANATALAAGPALAQTAAAASQRVRGVQVAADGARGTTQLAAVADIGAAAALLEEATRTETLTPSLWAQGVGGYSTVDGDDNAAGADASTWGVTLGGELELDRSVVGLFVGFTDTRTEVDGLDDNSDTDNVQLGVYGSHRFTDRLHGNATASVSYLGFDTRRSTALGTAEGDADGLGLYGTAEVLYDFVVAGNTFLSPLVGVEGSFVDRDGYQESGAGALNLTVSDGSNEYLTSVVGVQASTGFDRAGLATVLAARVGWAHQFLDTAGSTTSAFTAASGNTFTTEGAERDRDSLRLGVGLELSPDGGGPWSASPATTWTCRPTPPTTWCGPACSSASEDQVENNPVLSNQNPRGRPGRTAHGGAGPGLGSGPFQGTGRRVIFAHRPHRRGR